MEDYRLEQSGQEVQNILNGAAMQIDLTAEKDRAELAEQTLQGNIDDEASARETADGVLQGHIDDEEIRAKAAEKQNADDIDAIEEKIPSGASAQNKLATVVDLAAKQDVLTFDNAPTPSSTNPVTSGGVYTADAALQQAIEAILLLIPSAASALNQLADKSFVNSTVATASATFRGTYNLVSDLSLAVTATHAQIAAALAGAVSGADNNDYCFVQIPTSADTPTEIRVTERYKFNGETWAYEYDLNNSGFTAAQWEAINSAITSALVTKLSALPTASELTTLFAGKQNTLTFDDAPVSGSSNPVKSGGIYDAIAAITAVIPSTATSSNKLVDLNALTAYVTGIIGALDASFDLTSADGHVTLKMTQVDGVITTLQILTSDIASAQALTTLSGQVSTNADDIAALQQLYNNLQQSDPIVIEPTDTWPVANPSTHDIYRVIDRVNTPPQYYSDYMFKADDLTTPVLMATYNNAIDPRPKKASTNLVTSGGVFDNMGALDVSELNATENPTHTLAVYATLDAALAAIPADYQKGGMQVKFIQGSVGSSDKKYVQYFCKANSFTTNPYDWDKINLGEELDGSINITKPGIGGAWFAYEMKRGKRYRVINTGSVQLSAWNATSESLDARVDVLCEDLNGGKTGAIITASADTSYIRVGSTSGAATITIQDLDSIKGNLALINEGKESGVITVKSDAGGFMPFDFIGGHHYRVVNLSDINALTVFVAYDNHTYPPTGETLCNNLSVGNISDTMTVSQNANWLRASAGTIFTIIDLDVYNGKFGADTFAKSTEVQNLLKNGYLFKGIATPSTVPVVGNYFYIATEPGDYSNFGRGTLNAGNIVIIRYYDNEWLVETVNNVTTTINTILPPYEVGSGIVMASDGSIAQIGSGGGSYDGNIKYVKVRLLSYNKYTNITFKAHPSSLGGGYGFFVGGVWQGHDCPQSEQEITIAVPSGATEFRTFWNRNVFPVNDIVCNKPINAEDIERISKESVPLSNGIIFEPEYDMSKIPVQESITRTTDVDALYALYDGLLAQYPNYIEKVNLSYAYNHDPVTGEEIKPDYLGNDSIYAYVFSPKLTGDFYGEVDAALKPIKAMIVTGTHPDEWFNVFTTYRMLKMICENWKTIPDCELVRTRVKLYVVPCLNPWGFRNSARWNGHFGVNGQATTGVNLNRNFPSTNWVIDSSRDNNSGALPGSEYETQVLMYYVDLVKPITFIDYHTPRMDKRGHRGVWCGMDGKVYQQLGNSVIISTSNQERKEDNNYPSPETQLYYIDNHVATGEEYQWVAERGYGLAVLMEGGESNRWVNGVLTNADTELDTPKLMRENIQYCFNALLRMLHVATKMFM